jgi:hypothetical protein
VGYLRNAELAERPDGPLKEVRHELDLSYLGMTDRIDSAATLDSDSIYTEFIRQLNGYVTYFNEHSHRRPKKDLKNATVESIPEQFCTGREVTPLPVVHLDGELLAFAKDYFVTYKNNVKPGTATLIIHGKGACKGRKDVSFNILGIENDEL